MSSANNDGFTSSFPICIFKNYACLIAMARTSNAIMRKSANSGHPCLGPYLMGNAFSFSPLSMMLAVGSTYVAFIMLRYLSSILTLLRGFIINGCCILTEVFSACSKMII